MRVNRIHFFVFGINTPVRLVENPEFVKLISDLVTNISNRLNIVHNLLDDVFNVTFSELKTLLKSKNVCMSIYG